METTSNQVTILFDNQALSNSVSIQNPCATPLNGEGIRKNHVEIKDNGQDELRRERRREYDRKFRQKNKEKRNEYHKKWYQAAKDNPEFKEKEALRNKEYRAKNKEALALYSKQYYCDNKEKMILQKKQYYNANKEKEALQNKQYRDANKEKLALHRKKYRPVNESVVEQKYTDLFNGICQYRCDYGNIDIYTDSTLYEVKIFCKYKDCIGQLTTYHLQFPNHKLCAILYGKIPSNWTLEKVKIVFAKSGIDVIYDDSFNLPT